MKGLALRTHTKGRDLVYEAAGDVPDALIGDEGRLRQVLVNLTGNAIKFSERGESVVGVTGKDEGQRQKRKNQERTFLRPWPF